MVNKTTRNQAATAGHRWHDGWKARLGGLLKHYPMVRNAA